jgi:hypothetical protein
MTEMPPPKNVAESAAPTSPKPGSEQDLAFFGAPPLLKGEDPEKYNLLLETVSGTVQPVDIFERAFVRTVVNLIWEANRYRRLVGNTIVAAEQEALLRILNHLLYGTDTPLLQMDGDNIMSNKSQSLSRRYVLRQQAAVDEVDALLASAGLDGEVVKAEALSLRLREIEGLNRMIANAEARMKTTLREIDRHRKGFGEQMRRAIEQVDGPAAAPSEQPEDLKRAA